MTYRVNGRELFMKLPQLSLIEGPSRKILVGCFYRSNVTQTAPIDHLFTEIESFSPMYSDIILTGDFNLPNIDWFVPTAPTLHCQDEILDKFCSLGFHQHVLENTRGLKYTRPYFLQQLRLNFNCNCRRPPFNK